MNKIILIGGGGHCKSVIDVIEQEGKFKIAGIVDSSNLLGSKILGYKVIGKDLDLESLAKKYQYALITIGHIKSPIPRIKLFDLAVKTGFKCPSIISPNAYVSKHSKIGNGTVVMHHAIINANTSIGDNCIINSKALIEHDCLISSHCHISTNTTINGGTEIGLRCFIGSNVTTKDNIAIKEDSFIKANTLVK
ncbi:acetyltransferase [Candidatus Pelagibacter sp.]|jgi:sugar O-acyltransferase (sialic acid O-acetyltransferase NeuD family)|nr:acetyltransferase [Candidatus Pelagibacter sp.]|tara:strand:+ start:247 stop:825 length:579 start_codon:yes stop_codon:yes gene_type:complete